MMRPPFASLLLGVVALSGCSDSNSSSDNRPTTNPRVLWLGPDQNETHVKLVESEPPPY